MSYNNLTNAPIGKHRLKIVEVRKCKNQKYDQIVFEVVGKNYKPIYKTFKTNEELCVFIKKLIGKEVALNLLDQYLKQILGFELMGRLKAAKNPIFINLTNDVIGITEFELIIKDELSVNDCKIDSSKVDKKREVSDVRQTNLDLS